MKSLLMTASAVALVLQPVAAARAAPAPGLPGWGVDPNGFSATVRPGDDFYCYVNEAWLKTATPPDGVPYIDASVEVYLATEQRVAGLIAMARDSTDEPGSPEQMIGEFRVNGVVRNVDAWYEAFGVKPGDKLYLRPEQRVRIW